MHEAFAYPLIGALIGLPRLIVLDRPQAAYAPQILAAVGEIALLSTHTERRGRVGVRVTARALFGVLQARLYAQRRVVLSTCAGALVAGLLAPASLAGPVLFCSLLGIVLALAQSPGLHPHLDRCEQSAPLFGRELARAKGARPLHRGCAYRLGLHRPASSARCAHPAAYLIDRAR